MLAASFPPACISHSPLVPLSAPFTCSMSSLPTVVAPCERGSRQLNHRAPADVLSLLSLHHGTRWQSGIPVRCLSLLQRYSKNIDIFPGRYSSKHLQQFQKAFCWAVLCSLWNIIHSAFSREKKEINFWSACRLQLREIPMGIQKVTHRGECCSFTGQHREAARKSKERGSKQILNNIVLVRYNGDLSKLFVTWFFQEYAPLRCHQPIYFHFSQILLVLNPTTLSKYKRQICKASVSLAERACILFTELSISFNMSL